MKSARSELVSLLLAALCCLPLALPAQSSVPTDTAQTSATYYEQYLQRLDRHYHRLAPRQVKVQAFGDIGLLSAGPGWVYGRRDQWQTDLLMGYVPRYESDRAKFSLTLKQTYVPWSLRGGSTVSFEPLTCGLFANYLFGKGLWTRSPDRYPEHYYGKFITRTRLNLFVGEAVTLHVPYEKRRHAQAISVYYELSISEVNLGNAFSNSSLKPADYLCLGFGVRWLIY